MYTSERSLRRWVRQAVCVDSVVLREPEGRESSLRDEGRLEGAGISPRRPVEIKGEGGRYGLLKLWSAVKLYEKVGMPYLLFDSCQFILQAGMLA